MPEVTTPSVVAQRPRLSVAGAVDEVVSERIVSLSVRHCLGAPATLTLDLTLVLNPAEDTGDPLELADNVSLGTPVVIEIDDPPITIFSGRVTALDHRWSRYGRDVRVTAKDGLHEWAYAQRTRRFEDSSMSDVVAGLAGGYGLAAQTAAAASGLTRSWVQFNQTDLDFLAQVCATVGADFLLEDDELFVQTPARAANSAVSLQYGQSLLSFNAETDLSEQRTSVSVRGWDPATKQTIERRAEFPDAELRSCESGPRALDEHYARPANVHLHHAADSHVHADAVARAVYEDRAHRFVTARGTAPGQADLLIGEWLAVGGLDARHDGRYYLREVSHRYTAQDGFTTAFVAQRPCSDQAEDSSNDTDDPGDKCDGDTGGKPGRGRRFDPLARAGKLARKRRRQA